MTSSNGKDKAVGYIYTLYPVLVLAPRGSAEGVLQAKHQEAENLRGRFTSCTQGLALARALRDVAVREPVTRSSADLPEQFRDLLDQNRARPSDRARDDGAGHSDVRRLRTQGQQHATSPAKKQAREQIFNQRFQAEFEEIPRRDPQAGDDRVQDPNERRGRARWR